MYGCKDVEYDAKDDFNNEIANKKESQVDRWISFTCVLSEGKKNDHLACNAFLNYTNDYYDRTGLVDINIIVRRIPHAYDCANQFKCLQSF